MASAPEALRRGREPGEGVARVASKGLIANFGDRGGPQSRSEKNRRAGTHKQ